MRWPPCGLTGLPARAVVALVEGQEDRGRTGQLGHHVDLAVAHREMHQRPAREGQQRLGGLALGLGQAVEAVLVDGVADALGEVGLQLDRGHRQAVEEQHQVDAVLVVQRIAHLPHHPQPVGGVAGEDVGVDGQRRLELGQLQRLLQAEQFDAVAQHVQRAALVQLIAQAVQQRFRSLRAVVLGQGLPGLGLGGLHPGQHVGREQCPGPVVARCVAFGVEPAVGGEVLADLGLEADFFVQAHAACFSMSWRTSIWPVTAAEIRAVRRSCSRSMARWASAVRVSNFAVSVSRNADDVDSVRHAVATATIRVLLRRVPMLIASVAPAVE